MYPSINAKLKGMYSKKLKSEEIEELLKQNSTKQAIALLKSLNNSFKDLEDNPQRINIKMLLDDILIEDIRKIYRLLDDLDKKIFKQFISIYEIKCIKSIFRKVVSESNVNDEENETYHWINAIFKNLKPLKQVKDYESFLNAIKRTKYYKIFEEYNEKINVFEIENKLDRFYFEQMIKVATVYNNLEDMIGKQIDLNNIIWIYRVKRNYNFSEEEIKNILIKYTYKLKKSELEDLVETTNINEMTDILKKTYYAKYINFDDLMSLEENTDKYLYEVYKKYFRGNVLDGTSVYAYISMIDKENNDIMNIVEGIRYNLDRDEIQKKLVR